MHSSATIGQNGAIKKSLLGRNILVLVQGPLDQSPRMLAHARQLAAHGARVRMLGYGSAGCEAQPGPARAAAIEMVALPGSGRDTGPVAARGLPGRRLARAAFRAAAMLPNLRAALAAELASADLLLAQVPPALPAVRLAMIRARRLGVPVVLDWHNEGAALAAMTFGRRHPVVALVASTERKIARRADLNFAVTPRLARHLGPIEVIVLPDRPQLAPGESAGPGLSRLLARLGAVLPSERRWRVAVSPTSWSADEDMDLLLDAVADLGVPDGTGLLVVATGKGPRRAAFEARAATLRRPGIEIATGWLAEVDYRHLLAGADVGISLHRSASGLDFPMKIVDMEAAGLPVLALDYGPTLRDRLAALADATLFTGAADLTAHLRRGLDESGDRVAERAKYRTWPEEESWEATWRRTVLPALPPAPAR